jgi:hypothetical protein
MSDVLLDQLGAYGRFHRLQQMPVTVADVAERVEVAHIVDLVDVGELGTPRSPAPERSPVRRPRRRVLVAAAAVAALLVAGIVIVSRTGDDDTRIAPPADTSVSTPPTAPISDPQALFPPEGAPRSAPYTGEMVASIAFTRIPRGLHEDTPSDGIPAGWAGTSIAVSADGRVLWGPVPDVPGGMAERRLTPEGAELVRSEFLSSGLFLEGELGRLGDSRAWHACACTIAVRDGGSLMATGLSSFEPADPEVDRAVEHLVEYVTDLPASLPASAWEDETIRPYVPSRYRVCVKGDVESLAPLLPAATVRMLDNTFCHELATADARQLADDLSAAGVIVIPYYLPNPHRVYIEGEDPSFLYAYVTPILPDGMPAMVP